MKALKIGNVKLKTPIFLAPMVDVTDLPYRLICRKFGAGMAYSEMIYIDAILHKNKKTLKLMKTCKDDRPVGLQITGNNEEEFKKFVKTKTWKDFDIIDLNCGCPSLRITGNQAGSYLLKNPDKISRIIRILKKTGKPVTVKIRLGFKKNNVMKVAKSVEKAGADALTVHPRLAIHGNNVKADWSWIKKVKNNIGIPVIGNGDVFSGEDAKKMLEITDGVMIARGALGDPYIFDRILAYLKTGREKEFDFKKNISAFLDYLNLAEKHGVIDISRIKYIGSSFIRNVQGAPKLRNKLMKLKTFDEIKEFVSGIEKE
ncbi:MAG: tRNA-dihydrouridine synthase family protein [Nanoarchaeota archaeon]